MIPASVLLIEVITALLTAGDYMLGTQRAAGGDFATGCHSC